MKVTIKDYPETFTFETKAKLPLFNKKHCRKRDGVLHRALALLNINSPLHAYGDYTVESVQKTKDGEVWELGS